MESRRWQPGAARRCLAIALLAVALVTATGCSATQVVTVIPFDSEATVYVDGKDIGAGTHRVRLRGNRPHLFVARLGDRVEFSTLDIERVPFSDFLMLLPLFGRFRASGGWRPTPSTSRRARLSSSRAMGGSREAPRSHGAGA